MQKLNEMFNEASEYQAECQYIQQRIDAAITEDSIASTKDIAMDSDTTYAELFKNIPSIEEKVVNSCTTRTFELFRNFTMLYGIQKNSSGDFSLWNGDKESSNIPNIQEYIDSRNYYKERTVIAQNELNAVITQINDYLNGKEPDLNDPTYITLSQKRAGLEKNITNYKTMGDGWYITLKSKDDDTQQQEAPQYFVKGLYDFLLDIMQEQYQLAGDGGFLDNIANINNIINYYEDANDRL